MDWPSVITSIAGSGVLVAGITWVAKQSFEKILDSKLRAAEERGKAQVAETHRRQAAAFDKVFDTLRMATSLCYRARNKAREIADDPESVITGRRTERRRDAVRALLSYHEALEQLLFQERALIPADTFQFLHDQKHALQGFAMIVENIARRNRSELSPVQREQAISDISGGFEHLDRGYAAFVEGIEQFFHPEP